MVNILTISSTLKFKHGILGHKRKDHTNEVLRLEFFFKNFRALCLMKITSNNVLKKGQKHPTTGT